MKHLTTYKIFESDTNYGIYDWFEDIKSSQWGRSNNNLSESSLRLNTEHLLVKVIGKRLLL